MCGRYILNADSRSIAARFAAERVEEYEFFPNDNVAPTSLMPVVFTDEHTRAIGRMNWGLRPQWSLGKKMPAPFNARGETVAQKPMFRQALKRRRCLVPMNGFYEWVVQDNGKKLPVQITQPDAELFCTAGLWESAVDEHGEQIRTFTIVTVPSDEQMVKVHNRMPLFLSNDLEEAWMDAEASSEEIAHIIDEPIHHLLSFETVEPLPAAGRSRA